MHINIWQWFQNCFLTDQFFLFLPLFFFPHELQTFPRRSISFQLPLHHTCTLFFFHSGCLLFSNSSRTTPNIYIQLFPLNHSLLVLHIHLQFSNSQDLGMMETVLSKMTTNSFCEDVKCKTHHLPICPTWYFHLPHPPCPLPSAPAVPFLPLSAWCIL